MNHVELNKQLASALGWINIVEVNGSLLGTPPEGINSVRGQALVPNWAGNWEHCGPLQAKYSLSIYFKHEIHACGNLINDKILCEYYGGKDKVKYYRLFTISDFKSKDDALLALIVTSVTHIENRKDKTFCDE